MNWKKIYNIQILISIGLLIFVLINRNIKSNRDGTVWLVVETIAVVGAVIVFILDNIQLNIYLEKFRRLLSLTIMPFVILLAYVSFLNKLDKIFPHVGIVLQIIYLVGVLVILIPIAYVEYGQIKSNWVRLLCVPVLTESILFGEIPALKSSVDWLNDLVSSGLIGGFALIIFACIVVHKWDIKFNFVFRPRKSINFQLWVVIMLLIFAIWYTFVNSMLNTADNFSQAFWNFQFNLLDIKNSYQFDSVALAIFTALEAGIFEETERYLTLTTSLMLLKKSKWRVSLAVFISSAFFALLHYGNIWTEGRTFQDVSIQVIETFGFGCFVAVLYLYTGQIWLSMLVHAATDLIVFSQTYISTGVGLMNGYSFSNLLTLGIGVAIPIGFTIFMLFGKRRRFMEENANKLVEKIA